MIAAFEGWSDAGAATSTALEYLGDLIDAEMIHTIGSEGYVDYQVHRPKVMIEDDGTRTIDWPDTRLYATVQRPGAEVPPGAAGADAVSAAPTAVPGELTATVDEAGKKPDRITRLDGTIVNDLFLLAGVEPARNWQAYADELLELVDTWGITTVIFLGSFFSDAPHTRPIVTSLSSESSAARARFDASRGDYEGPAGITTIVEMALHGAGIETIALWAQVPHYVHSMPSPKATLALLDKLEELLDAVIPRGDLLDQATQWERNIDQVASVDDEMQRYIRRLEAARDTVEAPEATGDAIAYEFEKFLRIDPDQATTDDSGQQSPEPPADETPAG
nr:MULTISPECIES: PAC2 family protein [unclassified Leucobacter]